MKKRKEERRADFQYKRYPNLYQQNDLPVFELDLFSTILSRKHSWDIVKGRKRYVAVRKGD